MGKIGHRQGKLIVGINVIGSKDLLSYYLSRLPFILLVCFLIYLFILQPQPSFSNPNPSFHPNIPTISLLTDSITHNNHNNNMFHQLDQLEQNSPARQLKIDLNLKQEEPEWVDHAIDRVKKKKSQKKLPVIQPQVSPLLKDLQQQLEKAKKGVPKGTYNQIQTKLQELEYAVFVGQTTNTKDEYFDALYEHTSPNPYIKQEINETVMQTHRVVQKDIHRNNIDMSQRVKTLPIKVIPRNKGQLKQLENKDQVRLIQLKQGEIKSKIGNLRQEFQKETLKEKLRNKINTLQYEHLQKNFYSIDHPRTKEAEDFVKDLQYRKKEFQREIQNQAAMKQEVEMDRKQREQMQKEMERQERKTKLQEYYQSKLIQRMEEKQREKQKRLEYQEWVKSFQREKPLELEKEEQFRMKVIIPELQEQHKKLMTIKAEHRPIDPQEIAQHQEKYLEYKKDNSIRKRAELELKQQEVQNQEKQLNERLFKGKYRYLVLQQMIEEKYPINQKDIQQSKKDRIRAYNEHLRSFHQDVYGGQNQKEQKIEAQTISNQKFIKRVRNMNGSMNITNRQQESFDKDHQSDRPERKSAEERDPYKLGLQNLAFLRSMNREQKQKEEDCPPKIQLIQQKEVKPKGFLQVQREKKENKKKLLNAMSKEIQDTAATANEQIDAMKAKASMMDERLKRKQTKLKNVELNNLTQGQAVQQDYVNAIKAKIHMLGQFD